MEFATTLVTLVVIFVIFALRQAHLAAIEREQNRAWWEEHQKKWREYNTAYRNLFE